MNDPVALRLAELIAARICHDLASPLGPLVGVLELAREDPSTAAESLSVAEEAAATLARRIRLLRAAWGGDCGALDADGLRDLAGGLPGARRLVLDLAALPPGAAFPPDIARLLLNILLLAAESLPGGGGVAISGNAAACVQVAITGPRAAWPPGLAACLADPLAAALNDPRTLQAPLTALLARRAGLGLSLLPAAAAPAKLLLAARPSG